MKPDFRQEYGSVSGPGSLRSQYRLAPKAAGMLRRLANGGKRSGVVAVAIEVLFCVMLGTDAQVEECAETLAGLLVLDNEGPRALRRWADGARALAQVLDIEALKMVETILEQAAAK